jgi:hypothetical protein
MLVAIIFALVIFIMAFFSFYEDACGFFSYLGTSIGHIFVTALAFVVGLVIAGLLGLLFSTHWEENQVNLVSLNKGCGMEGTFFLGSGSIESSQYYYFYYESDNGGIKPAQINSDERVTIFEDSSFINTGVFTEKTKVINNQFMSKWIVNEMFSKKKEYNFHLPKNSIKRDFKP